MARDLIVNEVNVQLAMSDPKATIVPEPNPQGLDISEYQDDEPISPAEAASLAKLSTISPPGSSGPVIAVDLDDVLSQTNLVLAECKKVITPT